MKRVMGMLLLLALLLTGCAPSGSEGYRRVSAQEAADMMAREENYVLLDVRTEEEYAAGHIPGAILISNETIDAQPPEQLPDKNQLILVYCRSGNRSKQAAAKLAGMGYVRVVEFGGIQSWPGEIVAG